MRAFSSAVAAVLPAMAAAQPFWGGAPACVQSCVSSAIASSSFPAPTAFCAGSGGPPIASCVSASCGASTPAVASSYSSLSSAICSRYASCEAAGSTGVMTVTATAGVGGWGPFSGPPGAFASHSHFPSSGATTTFTVTGCPWATGWFGGPGGGGGGGGPPGWAGGPWGGGGVWGGGPGFWGASQSGWAYRTATTTITTTVTTAGSVVTTTGVATVEEAVSGEVTSTTTFFNGAQVTGTTSGGAGSARPLALGGSGGGSGGSGGDAWATVKIVGLALATLMAVVGML